MKTKDASLSLQILTSGHDTLNQKVKIAFYNSTINEYISCCRYRTSISNAISESNKPIYELIVPKRFQSLPAKPKWKSWRDNHGGGRPTTFAGYSVPSSVDGDDDRSSSEYDEDAVIELIYII